MAVLPDEIIRSRRKTLAVTIDSLGRVVVRAPLFMSEARIFAFLTEKERWIVKKKSEREGAGICLPPENLHGYEFLLLGKKCKICISDMGRVVFDPETDTVFLPAHNSKERLVKWLKENAGRVLKRVTDTKARHMKVPYQSVSITSARGRWGSCSGNDALHYSFRLIYVPQDVIEYVVVHELSHVKHKNHSKAFWEEVEKYIPDWKEKRAWLKKHGGLMDVF